MTFLTEAEKETLANQVIEAERETSVEIVTAIAAESDGYRYIPTLYAAFIALFVPVGWLLLASLPIGETGWRAEPPDPLRTLLVVSLLQIAVFTGLALFVQTRPERIRLVPERIRRERAARFAREQFFALGLHETEARNGLLIFVSVAEHYVEILADRGLADRVEDGIWQSIVDDFTREVRAGRVASGFEIAVTRCGEIARYAFPAESRNPNELPDPLVEL